MINTLRFLFSRLFFPLMGLWALIASIFSIIFLVAVLVPTPSVGGDPLLLVFVLALYWALMGGAFGVAATVLISLLLLIQRVLRLRLSQRAWEWGVPLIATLIFSVYPANEMLVAARSFAGLPFASVLFYLAMLTVFLLVCVRTMRAYYRKRVQSVEPAPVSSRGDSDLRGMP